MRIQRRAFLHIEVLECDGQPPELRNVDILSDEHPTTIFPQPGPNVRFHQVMLLSVSGRTFAEAAERLMRRVRRNPLLVWLLPWLRRWEKPSPQVATQSSASAPAPAPAISTTSRRRKRPKR